jgi:hypothetical protein
MAFLNAGQIKNTLYVLTTQQYLTFGVENLSIPETFSSAIRVEQDFLRRSNSISQQKIASDDGVKKKLAAL